MSDERDEDTLRTDYSSEFIRSGERGKYAKRLRDEGSNVVLIALDLRQHFPDSDSVNRALRDYLRRDSERDTS